MTASEPVAAADAPRVGADLRAARERLGWRLPDMARELRIRLPYLAALEEGRIADLPGNAYALGFLRSYAAALGLDPEELSRRFKAEAATVSRKIELAFPAPLPERGIPTGAVLLLGLVLVVGAYAGWYRLSGEGRLPAETVPPVPRHLAPLIASVPPAAPSAATGAAQSGAPGAAVTPPVAAASAGTTATGTASTGTAGTGTATTGTAASATPPATPDISPSSAAAATTVPAQFAGVTVPARTMPGTAAPPPTATASPAARVVLAASADAWMEVRDASGQILLNRVLHAGDTWPVPAGAGLRLTTGNAGGTYLLVDGSAGPPLGKPGAVRRDLTLNPDRIKAGALGQPAPGGAPSPAPAATSVYAPSASPAHAPSAIQPPSQSTPAR